MSSAVYERVSADLGTCSIGDEMLSYRSITPLPDGNWQMILNAKTSAAHPAGASICMAFAVNF